jgi:hypothetical protein
MSTQSKKRSTAATKRASVQPTMTTAASAIKKPRAAKGRTKPKSKPKIKNAASAVASAAVAVASHSAADEKTMEKTIEVESDRLELLWRSAMVHAVDSTGNRFILKHSYPGHYYLVSVPPDHVMKWNGVKPSEVVGFVFHGIGLVNELFPFMSMSLLRDGKTEESSNTSDWAFVHPFKSGDGHGQFICTNCTLENCSPLDWNKL